MVYFRDACEARSPQCAWDSRSTYSHCVDCAEVNCMCMTGVLSRHADGVQALRSMSWPTARLSSATAAIRRRIVSMTTRCRCVERATAASGTMLTCAGATARVSSSRSPCLDMMSTCATRKVGGGVWVYAVVCSHGQARLLSAAASAHGRPASRSLHTVCTRLPPVAAMHEVW